MSTTTTDTQGESLYSFTKAESICFIRRVVGMVVFVGTISLPAAVLVLGAVPAAAGYLLISMASLVIIFAGGLNGNDQDEEDSDESDTSESDFYEVAILYIFIGIPFSVLLMVGTIGGHLLMEFNYPTAGLAFAAVFPYLDRRAASVHRYASVVNSSGYVTYRLMIAFSVIYSIPNTLPDYEWVSSSMPDHKWERKKKLF